MGPRLYCMHCGNQGIHSIINSVIENEKIEIEPENYNDIDFEIVFVRCENCKRHSLFSFLNGDSDESYSLYPKEKQIEDTIPSAIKKAYEESLRIKQISPIAFTIMIRRTLDFICKLEGAKGFALSDKIKYLGEENIIPKQLSDMAETIRLLGNKYTHEDIEETSNSEVDVIEYFLKTIIDYLYVIPNKMDVLKKKIEKLKT